MNYSVVLMTQLQIELQVAQRMINLGIDETIVAQALTQVLIDNYGLPVTETPTRKVCQNTFIPEFKYTDEAKWYEDYNGFMTERP